jgi:hypothetical protein
MSESLRPVIFWFIYLGAAATVAGYMEIACWELAGMRQANRIRCVSKHTKPCFACARVCSLAPRRVTRGHARTHARRRQYLTALLRQEMAFFDSHDSGALLARVVTDTNAIQEALSSKCPNLIHHGCAGIIGIIIGLARGWQMALVTMSTLPLMGARARTHACCGASEVPAPCGSRSALTLPLARRAAGGAGYVMAMSMQHWTKIASESYADASAFAKETFCASACVRTSRPTKSHSLLRLRHVSPYRGPSPRARLR